MPENIPPIRSRFENDGLYRGRDCGKTRRCGFCGRRTRTIIIANRASYAQCDAAHERYRYDDSPVCEKLEGLHTRILDTRKTTPGMRMLEKEAVKIGGGVNHRIGLFDMILLKDNHVDLPVV